MDFFHASTAQTLMDGVVFAVDGQQRLALLEGSGGDELAGGDQTFLVREAENLAGFDSLIGGFESGDAHDGAHDEVDLRVRGDPDCAGRAVDDFDVAEAAGSEFLADLVGALFVGKRENAGLPADGLLEGRLDIGAGGEGHDFKSVGIGFSHAESAPANRAGGTQDGDALHAGAFILRGSAETAPATRWCQLLSGLQKCSPRRHGDTEKIPTISKSL